MQVTCEIFDISDAKLVFLNMVEVTVAALLQICIPSFYLILIPAKKITC